MNTTSNTATTTTFAHAFFRMNGLIHDLKTYMDSTTKEGQALKVIEREASSLCAKDSIVDKASFKAIMMDYGFVINYTLYAGYIQYGDDIYVIFPLVDGGIEL